VADIVVSPRAASDADEIILYLAQHSQPAADEFVELLDGAFDRLSTYPMIGVARDRLYPGIRILVVERYLVVHRIRGDVVDIITILDRRRDSATLEAIVRDDVPPDGP
jgi:plasmid stabilization system protein ParE